MNEELFERYRRLQDEINELKDDFSRIAEGYFHELFKPFLQKYNGYVDHLHWVQFTPFFNDGEACNFGVGDLFIVLTEDLDDEYEEWYSDGSEVLTEKDVEHYKELVNKWELFESNPAEAERLYRRKHDDYLFVNKSWHPTWHTSKEEAIKKINQFTKQPKELSKDWDDIQKVFSNIPDEMFEWGLGDHSRIEVRVDELVVNEYEHE